jgi:hypothetical protein
VPGVQDATSRADVSFLRIQKERGLGLGSDIDGPESTQDDLGNRRLCILGRVSSLSLSAMSLCHAISDEVTIGFARYQHGS